MSDSLICFCMNFIMETFVLRSLEMIKKLDDDLEIKASNVNIADAELKDLMETDTELEGSNEREPRFQIYWMTTTKYVQHTVY